MTTSATTLAHSTDPQAALGRAMADLARSEGHTARHPDVRWTNRAKTPGPRPTRSTGAQEAKERATAGRRKAVCRMTRRGDDTKSQAASLGVTDRVITADRRWLRDRGYL